MGLRHTDPTKPGRMSAMRRMRCHLHLEVLEGRCLPSTVTNLNDAGAGSLRQAIMDTPSGGTVDFQAGLTGTITLTTGELLVNKDLTIAGPGADVITVSGNHASRVFEIADSSSVGLSGLTIADGEVSSNQTGGGILNAGFLEMHGCVVRDNSGAGSGGGLYNSDIVTVADSAFTGNRAGFGGGLGTSYFGITLISQSTVSENVASDGGGIYNGGQSTVMDSRIVGNIAGFGGGMLNDGTLNVVNSTVDGNISTDEYPLGGAGIANTNLASITGCTLINNVANNSGHGGAIFNFPYGSLTVSNSLVNHNSAGGDGGGIANYSNFGHSSVIVTHTTVSSNTSIRGAGGGIFNDSNAVLTVSDSAISDNSAAFIIFGGGGIFNGGSATIGSSSLSTNSAPVGGGITNDGDITINDCTISNNLTTAGGGRGVGGGVDNEASMTVNNTTFTANLALTYGGAVYNGGFGATVLVQSTFAGNVADTGGGALALRSRRLSARNNVIATNIAPFGPDVDGGLGSLGHNLVGNSDGGSNFDPSDILNVDPILGPLQDNGGPTLTMALLPGSPAIDAGDSSGVPQWDQRGATFRRIVNGRVDIGAFEVQSIESPINGPYNSFVLPPCDHCSSSETPLGFTFDFFGRTFDSAWVNNNGTISLDGPFGSFVPGPLAATGRALLAPYWADAFTSGADLGQVTFGQGTLDGDPAFGATWENVASYHPTSLLNTFQVVLVDHTARLGYFEIQFNYYTIRWDRADSSNQAPRVGYSNGAGVAEEISDPGNFNVLLDDGSNSLQVVRRYTVIVYPTDSGGSPVAGAGEAYRLAGAEPVQVGSFTHGGWVARPEHREARAQHPSLGCISTAAEDSGRATRTLGTLNSQAIVRQLRADTIYQARIEDEPLASLLYPLV